MNSIFKTDDASEVVLDSKSNLQTRKTHGKNPLLAGRKPLHKNLGPQQPFSNH